MKKKILKIIGIAILIILIYFVVQYFNQGHICEIEKIKSIYINSKEYDMSITKGEEKVLIDIGKKTAYHIGYDLTLMNHYIIYEIKLTDEGINKLKEYANLQSDDERRKETVNQEGNKSFNIYDVFGYERPIYIIEYKAKENKFKWYSGIEEKLDFVILFDNKTKEY